jgi:hypothetical protein
VNCSHRRQGILRATVIIQLWPLRWLLGPEWPRSVGPREVEYILEGLTWASDGHRSMADAIYISSCCNNKLGMVWAVTMERLPNSKGRLPRGWRPNHSLNSFYQTDGIISISFPYDVSIACTSRVVCTEVRRVRGGQHITYRQYVKQLFRQHECLNVPISSNLPIFWLII